MYLNYLVKNRDKKVTLAYWDGMGWWAGGEGDESSLRIDNMCRCN